MGQKIILVVDDEPSILGLLQAGLELEGFKVFAALNGDKAIQIIHENKPDIVLLDINMPGMSGFEVCRHIAATTRTPVIMLTARGDIMDEVECFDLGAEDYIIKPIRLGDVIARVNGVLQRHENITRTGFVAGDLEINFEAKTVKSRGLEVKLAPKEYYLLEALVLDSGKALSIEQLLHKVWGQKYSAEKHYVHEYIKRLRAKIEANHDSPIYIITVPGIGYRFEINPRSSHSA